MRSSMAERSVRWVSLAAGAAVAVLGLVLIADGIAEIGRAAAEEGRLQALEERILTDAAAAEALSAGREQQTARSVAREARNRRLGYALLVATALFLGAVKRRQALGAEPLPATPAESPALVSRIGAFPLAPAPAVETRLDLAPVDTSIERWGASRESAIPILQALQEHYRYLPDEALRRVCERTEITPSEIIGVASFYAQFRRQPVGRHLVRVCHGTACHVAGIEFIMDELRRRLAIAPDGHTDPGRRYTLDPVNCLGCCSLAPVLMIGDHVAGRLTPATACHALADVEAES